MKERKLRMGDPGGVWETAENLPRAWPSRPFMSGGGGKREQADPTIPEATVCKKCAYTRFEIPSTANANKEHTGCWRTERVLGSISRAG